MKVAYVAGPYRGQGANGIVQNILNARAVAVELWQMGYAVVTPHLNTALMDGAAPDSVWLAGDLEIMRRCDLVVLLPGWAYSEGAVAEYLEAQRRGIPVYPWPMQRETLALEVQP